MLGWSLGDARRTDILSEAYPNPERRREVLEFLQSAEGRWKDFKTRTRDGRLIDTSWVRVGLSGGTRIGFAPQEPKVSSVPRPLFGGTSLEKSRAPRGKKILSADVKDRAEDGHERSLGPWPPSRRLADGRPSGDPRRFARRSAKLSQNQEDEGHQRPQDPAMPKSFLVLITNCLSFRHFTGGGLMTPCREVA